MAKESVNQIKTENELKKQQAIAAMQAA